MTTTPTTASVPSNERSATRPRRRTPLLLTVAAWSVPVLVLGQFALLAVVPVAGIAIETLVGARARALRRWALPLVIAYAVPLAIWIVRPDPAASLSKDIAPALVALVVAASIPLLVRITARRKG